MSKKSSRSSGTSKNIKLPQDIFGYVENLEELTGIFRNPEKEDIELLCGSLESLTSPLSEKQWAHLAVYFTDKIYQVVSSVLMYDKAFDVYLSVLRRMIFNPLLQMQIPVAYLVDNTFPEATKRMPIIARAFRSAGFSVYSPEMTIKKNPKLSPQDCIKLWYADFFDILRNECKHCMFFTYSNKNYSEMYSDFLDEFAKNKTHICIFRQAASASNQIVLSGALRKKYGIEPEKKNK